MQHNFVLVLFAILGAVKSDSVPFEDCGSEYYLYEVNIEGCSRLPCCLSIGSQHKISMAMYTRSPSLQLTQQVFFILQSIYSGVNITPDDPCSQIACPIDNNDYRISFSAAMNINSTLVPLNGQLYWTIRNEAGRPVVCMRTDIGLQHSCL